jgi:hypothetical protein
VPLGVSQVRGSTPVRLLRRHNRERSESCCLRSSRVGLVTLQTKRLPSAIVVNIRTQVVTRSWLGYAKRSAIADILILAVGVDSTARTGQS